MSITTKYQLLLSLLSQFATYSALDWMVRRWRDLLYRGWVLLFCVFLCPVSYAALDMNGKNRFIFNAGHQRLSISIKNNSENMVLIQNSLRWGNGSEAELPLAVNKPMQVLNPYEQTEIEVFYQGEGLPEDRESYFLLSVLDVVQAEPEPDTVHIALQHHFKLFFRPALTPSPEQAIEDIRWKRVGQAAMSIENPSPYFVTLSDIQWLDAENNVCGELYDHVMIAPFSTSHIESVDCSAMVSAQYDYVGDSGRMRAYHVDFLPEAGAKGVAR